jgi:hypothetical protein
MQQQQLSMGEERKGRDKMRRNRKRNKGTGRDTSRRGVGGDNARHTMRQNHDETDQE